MIEPGITGWLTAIVFLPMVGALLIVLICRDKKHVRLFAAAIAFIELFLAIAVFSMYQTDSESRYQLVDLVQRWISIDGFTVQYFLGVDGLSVPLVLLTGLLGVVAIFASWNIDHRVKEHFVCLLVLQTSVMGVFTSLDFLLFFFFWELELLPMFLLISMWGSGRSGYSAMKFLIFTILGSAFMLVGILAVFFSTGTFDMTALPGEIQIATLVLPAGVIFAMLFIGFAVKLPVWPLHSWLPDAHTDAPTAASVMLAGVLIKMGGYGMIRVSASMFPGVMTETAWLLAVAGVVNVLYGAVVTLRQTDLKRLIAFSSISHMGFVLLGLSSVVGVVGSVSPIGLAGASLQMFTHGTITGLMFLVVGFIYEKVHTRYIPDLGGLATRMPILASALLIAGLASLGLPLTSGFVSEIMVFLGAFPVWKWMTIMCAFGIVLTAGYIMWMIQRTLFGPQKERFDNIKDATVVELIPIGTLVAAILVVGIYPALITDVFHNGIQPIVESLEQAVQSSLK